MESLRFERMDETKRRKLETVKLEFVKNNLRLACNTFAVLTFGFELGAFKFNDNFRD